MKQSFLPFRGSYLEQFYVVILVKFLADVEMHRS